MPGIKSLQNILVVNELCKICCDPGVSICLVDTSASVTLASPATARPASTSTNVPRTERFVRTGRVSTPTDRSNATARWVSCTPKMSSMGQPAARPVWTLMSARWSTGATMSASTVSVKTWRAVSAVNVSKGSGWTLKGPTALTSMNVRTHRPAEEVRQTCSICD